MFRLAFILTCAWIWRTFPWVVRKICIIWYFGEMFCRYLLSQFDLWCYFIPGYLWMWCVEINIYHCIGISVILALIILLLWNWVSLCLVHICIYRIVIVSWWNFSLMSMKCPYLFWLLLVWCLFWQVCFSVLFVEYISHPFTIRKYLSLMVRYISLGHQNTDPLF